MLNKSRWNIHFLKISLLIFSVNLGGCVIGSDRPVFFVSGDEAHHVYKLYPGKERPDSEIAKLELTDVYYVVIDGFHVDQPDYQKVLLLPGTYEIDWGYWGRKGVLVKLYAGRTYELHAESHYRWIQDADTGEVIAGTKKP